MALITRHLSTVSSAPQSGVTSLIPTASSGVVEQPALTLRRLSRMSWSGRVSWEMERGRTQVWLDKGCIVWAESSRQHRGLGRVLSELLSIDQAALRALAQNWREQRMSWVDAVLAEPSIGIGQVRGALQEHLRAALFPLTTCASCRHRLEAAAATFSAPAGLRFAPEEILCRPGAQDERESLLQLAERVYGARAIDVVVGGSAAGFGAEHASDQRLLEAADALLLGPESENDLVVLRGADVLWAGLRSAVHEETASTWLAFDAELGLGGALMGLRAVLPASVTTRRAPVLHALESAPSLFPGAAERTGYRSVLAEALRLGDGGVAAHVFERDVVAWGSIGGSADQRALLEGLSRANSALDLCCAGQDPNSESHAFVLLAGPSGFHLGGRIAGAARASLFLSFAAGASYGQGVAALSVGLSALSRHLRD